NVILKENVDSVGAIGDIVKVSNGYFRNFLLPNKLAVHADEHNTTQVEHQKRALKKKLAKVRGENEDLKKRIEALSIEVRRKAGEGQKLFGSITNADVAEAIEAQGIKLDRKQIDLGGSIKKVGDYKVPVRLMDGIIAEVKLSVVAEAE
ncbi:MAG: 50S ribosomal protein L9, partial [Proteobacteria bacterium]